MKIENITKNLTQKDSGIWFSSHNNDVSYPKDGHNFCHGIESTSFWYRHRNECILDTIKTSDFESPFLDIGGGNGTTAKMIEEAGIDTIALEPGLQGALNAKKSGLSHVICSTFTEAGFIENSICAAGIFDVLEHIKDDDGFLLELKKVLKPGGKLIITVPAYNLLWSANDNRVGHYRRYRATMLISQLKKHGYSIDFSTYLFSFMILPVLLIRTIPYRLGLYKNVTKEKIEKELNPKQSLIIKTINALMKIELFFLKKMKHLPFGTTVMIVATNK